MAGRWVAGALAASLACSPVAEPAVQVPSPPTERRARESVRPVEEGIAAAPEPERDCLEEGTITEAPAPAWSLVGTTDEPPLLSGMGSVVFVSTEKRLYDAGPGEPLVASTARASGLGRKRVLRMVGTWPEDAWLGTFEGVMRSGGGGHKFHLWSWQRGRWVRLTRSVIYGDGAPELYKYTAGRALELRCAEGPGLVFRAYGGAGEVAPLERAPHSSFCPQVFYAAATGDLVAIDELRGDAPEVQMSQRCATCREAQISSLPSPRLCGQAPTWSVWGMRVPRRADPAQLVLAAHTSVVMPDGRGQQSGTFLLWREGEGWRVEAVPGGATGGAIDGMVRGPDGSLWLVTERLLRRDVDGAWWSVPLPAALREAGVRADLWGVATLADEVWLLAEVVREGESVWSVFRTGVAGPALDLDTNKVM